jgi:hypothetical protein
LDWHPVLPLHEALGDLGSFTRAQINRYEGLLQEPELTAQAISSRRESALGVPASSIKVEWPAARSAARWPVEVSLRIEVSFRMVARG